MVAAALHHGILLLPGFAQLTLAALLDALAAANEALGRAAHGCTLLSADGGAVRAGNGQLQAVASALAHAPAIDVLHVLCSRPPDPDGADQPALRAGLQAHARCTLVGIGCGAALLADAGLLAGHRATLSALHVPELAAEHADVVFSSNLYEIDRSRLSCAGGTAVIDLLLAWLAARHGEKLLPPLLAHFGLARLRDADERQPGASSAPPGGSAKLAEAVALMEANLAEPLPTEDIARLVGVSRRQLERLFKQHMDALPSRWYAELRLARARRLLQQTSQSILQVGLACGFASGSHFSNAYRAHFGHTPRDERRTRAVAWRDTPAADPSLPDTAGANDAT